MTKILFVKPCTLCKMSYNVPRQFVGGGGGGVGAVDIRGWWGGVVKIESLQILDLRRLAGMSPPPYKRL